MKLFKQKNPSEEELDRLHKLIVSTPAAWDMATLTMSCMRQTLINKIVPGVTSALMKAEVDIMAKQLNYDTAPPIERLLIDHVLTVRLRLLHIESAYNSAVVNQSISLNAGAYWDNLLSSTQNRFLKAIETLARVQRLARNTPALQINIAQEGGKQVNVQGETPAVNNQRC